MGRRIVPVLCATDAERSLLSKPMPSGLDARVWDLVRTNSSDLCSSLLLSEQSQRSACSAPINPERWLSSPYRPTPTIVEAASLLYEGHDVSEISHHHAHNLDRTVEMLRREIEEARRSGQRTVCFVTGVPGAGKTLAGLEVVHDRSQRLSGSSAAIFLSGNGPLVKIVREALVQGEVRRGRVKRDVKHKVETFVQNVHSFLRYHVDRTTEPPHENVVVFDEAQRAWDSKQMNLKQGIDASEASLLLDVMERLSDWAVIISVVGGGQEIFTGEAGLEEWGHAILNRSTPWHVVASPEAILGGDSVAGHRLFGNTITQGVTYREEPLAHLDVVVRNHRAQRWTQWVNEVLACRFVGARPHFPDTLEFPCFVTRDLENARGWLRMHHSIDPAQRIGLVATSEDVRLRAYGLERSSAFRSNYAFEKWFLAPDNDVRSSVALEIAASEFECQGLELDWVGMCWGGDLTPFEDDDGLSWDYRKFRGANWQNVNQEAGRTYTLNRYRVLLTRARKGLVIWIPEGEPNDPTRDPAPFDRVFKALRQAGVPVLEDHFGD